MTGNPNRHILARFNPPDGHTYHPSRADAERTIREELPGVTIRRTGQVVNEAGEVVAKISRRPSNSGPARKRRADDDRVELRVTAEQRANWEGKALAAGLPLGTWLKRVADGAK